jgi:5-methylcytosine-specific restriction protein A
MRNPPWARDERILALDLYLTRRHSLPAHESTEIADLSAVLGRLASKLGLAGDASYRNRNGVYMKLMNFRALDPEFTRGGKVGLKSLGRGDREVWQEFSSAPQRCHMIAEAIRTAVAKSEVPHGTHVIGRDWFDEIPEAEEGRLLTRLHIERERNRDLVKAKKLFVLKRQGALRCEACGFDFKECYGERGNGFVECHHTRPFNELPERHKTRISDLALLCSNCHRMIHVRRPWLSVDQLRTILAQ